MGIPKGKERRAGLEYVFDEILRISLTQRKKGETKHRKGREPR